MTNVSTRSNAQIPHGDSDIVDDRCMLLIFQII